MQVIGERSANVLLHSGVATDNNNVLPPSVCVCEYVCVCMLKERIPNVSTKKEGQMFEEVHIFALYLYLCQKHHMVPHKYVYYHVSIKNF